MANKLKSFGKRQAKVDGIDLTKPRYTIGKNYFGDWTVYNYKGKAIAKLESKDDAERVVKALKEGRSK